MSPSEELSEYTLGVTDVAGLLGRQPMTIRRWIQDGKLPAKRIGKLYKLRPADVDAFVEGADVVPTTSEEPPTGTMASADPAALFLDAETS